MQWQSLASFNLNSDWQLSPPTTATVFRFAHRFVNLYKYQVAAQVALVRVAPVGVEIFAPQKIYPKTELDVVYFPSPPSPWQPYSVAIKQLILPNQSLVNWSVQIDMPLYNLTGSDPVAAALQATSFTATTPTATNAASKILSANPQRKSASIYNPSTTAKVYLDMVSTVTPAAASIVIPPGSVYIADLPWVGDVYAVIASGSVVLQVREFV